MAYFCPKYELFTLSPEIIKQKNDGLLFDLEDEPTPLKNTSMPTKQLLTMIAAAGKNNALGKNNDLIWHISEDLKRFKRLTSGHAIIMERKTFESMPKALPNRTNIVLTKKEHYAPEGALVVHSIQEALDLVKNDAQPFIIGGGEIYRLFMNYCDRIELTRVHHDFDADVYFPEIDENQWEIIAEEAVSSSENQPYDYTYLTYEKK